VSSDYTHSLCSKTETKLRQRKEIPQHRHRLSIRTNPPSWEHRAPQLLGDECHTGWDDGELRDLFIPQVPPLATMHYADGYRTWDFSLVHPLSWHGFLGCIFFSTPISDQYSLPHSTAMSSIAKRRIPNGWVVRGGWNGISARISRCFSFVCLLWDGRIECMVWMDGHEGYPITSYPWLSSLLVLVLSQVLFLTSFLASCSILVHLVGGIARRGAWDFGRLAKKDRSGYLRQYTATRVCRLTSEKVLEKKSKK